MTTKDFVDFIRPLLTKCNTEHQECNSNASDNHNTQSSYVPRRLIYIGNRTPVDRPLLYEPGKGTTNLYGTGAPYIAPSHCWGKKQLIRTTSSTISDYEQAIPWGKLSRTFQEAIAVTRALDIDYIWIDSLCIIQDSIDDWSRESSQMANVYSNSYLTIGASGSRGEESRLLNRRHHMHEILRASEGVYHTIWSRRVVGHEIERRENCETDISLLRTRPWCLQEELLSPCFVLFRHWELVWVCRKGATCECDPSYQPSVLRVWLRARQELVQMGWCGLVVTIRVVTLHFIGTGSQLSRV